MAPPVPVFNSIEISAKYKDQINNPEKYQCELKSLTQHECTFKVFEDSPPEIICLPFKRIFLRCLLKEKRKHETIERWINIEVTDKNTNADLFSQEKYKPIVAEFLNTEREFRKMMEV